MKVEDLGSGDWPEVFAFAGDVGVNSASAVVNLCIGETCSVLPVRRADVVVVVAASEGENDGISWMIVVALRDGRFAYVEAGCDYTGWDCQAFGSAVVASSLPNLIAYGLTDEARERLGLRGALPEVFLPLDQRLVELAEVMREIVARVESGARLEDLVPAFREFRAGLARVLGESTS